MDDRKDHLPGRWPGYVVFVPAGYQVVAFAVAAAQILAAQETHSIIPSFLLVSGAGIYTLFKALHPVRWYQSRS